MCFVNLSLRFISFHIVIMKKQSHCFQSQDSQLLFVRKGVELQRPHFLFDIRRANINGIFSPLFCIFFKIIDNVGESFKYQTI